MPRKSERIPGQHETYPCTKCRRELPAHEFYEIPSFSLASIREGKPKVELRLTPRCRDCISARQRERRIAAGMSVRSYASRDPGLSSYTCTICKRELPEDSFSTRTRTQQVTSACKECAAARQRNYYRARRDARRASKS